MARILVSAAHTLESPGAIHGDLKEAELTRKILKKVMPHLEKSGVTSQAVPLDLPLLQRIDWINNTGYTEAQGDIFLEIHINDGGKRGIEGWFKGSADADNRSQKLADKVVTEVCKKTNYQNIGVKSEYDHELGSLLILNQINPTGVAIEFLFIDNEEDIAILKDEAKTEDLAKGIADVLVDFAKTDNTKPAPKADASKAPLFPMADPSKPLTPPSSLFPAGGPSAFGGLSPKLPTASGASKPNNLMDREERKKMITEVYKKILGKEPNQNDLNFNLNTAVSEEDLTKKLLESKDHETMVKDAAEAKELRTKAAKAESDLATVSGKIADQTKMVDTLNKLLVQKNNYIAQLHNELERNQVIKRGSRYYEGKAENITSQARYEQNYSLRATITKILMKVFNV